MEHNIEYRGGGTFQCTPTKWLLIKFRIIVPGGISKADSCTVIGALAAHHFGFETWNALLLVALVGSHSGPSFGHNSLLLRHCELFSTDAAHHNKGSSSTCPLVTRHSHHHRISAHM